MPSALIYARVSHDPSQQGRSVDSQVVECQAWADREGWTVTEIIREVDRSASRHAKRQRDGWREVQRRVEAGDVDVVVTWEASHAHRDLAAYADLRALCERSGTRWAYSGQVYDLADRSDRFRTGLDALVAEDEADRISERVRRGVRSAAMEGRPTGRKLYGYRRIYDNDTGELIRQEPDPDQAPVVAEVARRFLAGESLRSIERSLNERGAPTPTGHVGKWAPRQVRRLISTPAYAGLRVHRGEIIGPAAWEPIHDADTWARLCAKLADPARQTTRARDGAHLLTGVAICGVCGKGLQFAQDKGRRQYGCRNRGYHVVRDGEALDAYVTAIVLERLAQPDAVEAMSNEPTDEVLEARTEVGEIQARLDDLAAEFTQGTISAQMLGKAEGVLLKQLSEAQGRARFAGLPSTAVEMASTDDVSTVWDALTMTQRREVMRALLSVRVDRVTVPGRKGFDARSVAIEWKR